jgi:hypothetical protein
MTQFPFLDLESAWQDSARYAIRVLPRLLVTVALACSLPAWAAPPASAQGQTACAAYGQFVLGVATDRDAGVPVAAARASVQQWDAAHHVSPALREAHAFALRGIYQFSSVTPQQHQALAVQACLRADPAAPTSNERQP